MPAVTVVRSLFRYALLFLMSFVITALAAVNLKSTSRWKNATDTFFIDSTSEVPVTQRTARGGYWSISTT